MRTVGALPTARETTTESLAFEAGEEHPATAAVTASGATSARARRRMVVLGSWIGLWPAYRAARAPGAPRRARGRPRRGRGAGGQPGEQVPAVGEDRVAAQVVDPRRLPEGLPDRGGRHVAAEPGWRGDQDDERRDRRPRVVPGRPHLPVVGSDPGAVGERGAEPDRPA